MICVGPGKAFDTDKYFVICSNVIGGCKGTTGPASINPATGKPYGLSFPVVTIADMVNAQRHLIDHLGIDQLLTVVGGSMGGMQALQWAVAYPERVRSAIPLATTARLSPQSIAFDEVGRQAIYADPDWNDGDYYDQESGPNAGLALARMIGHITYLSPSSPCTRSSAAACRTPSDYGYDFKTEFAVESYLHYQGDNFVQRFDANSYLYITKAMDYFDLANGLRLPASGALPRSRRSSWWSRSPRLAVPVLPVQGDRQRADGQRRRRHLLRHRLSLRPRRLPARGGAPDRPDERFPGPRLAG